MNNKNDQRLDALSPEKKALFERLLEKRRRKEEGYAPFSLLCDADKEKLPEGVEDAFPLGAVQTGMLFQMERVRDVHTPPDYHNVSTFILAFDTKFEFQAIQNAVQEMVAHEPMFRTSFDLHGFSEPLQLVHSAAELTVGYHDLRECSDAERRAALEEWITRENFDVIDVSKAPLIKLFVHHLEDRRIAFSLTEPHSISDGWSTHLNLIDIFNLYFAELDGGKYVLETNAVSYAEFIRLERETVASRASRVFWRQALQSCSLVELPQKAPKTEDVALGDHRHDEFLPVELLEKLNLVVEKAGVPIKSVLLAAHARLLSLLSGEKRITTGLNFNGRLETAGGTAARGMFLNTLPVTLSLDVDSWLKLAQQAYQHEIDMIPHRRYPLGILQAEYGNKSLFDTAFSFLHFHSVSGDPLAQAGRVECEEVIDYSKTNFDLNSVFSIYPTGEKKLEHKHDANLDRFSPAQLKQYYKCFELILQDIAENPDANPNRKDFIPESKRNQLIYQYNGRTEEARTDATLHSLFEQQVLETPDAVAIDSPALAESLTYDELNRKANRVAAELANRGIGPGQTVAVRLPLCGEVIVSILGILKAGAAYVPLDPTLPEARLAAITKQAECACVLARGSAPASFPAKWLEIESIQKKEGLSEQNPGPASAGSSTAYVLFTSGSTGLPKGVVVPHRGVVNYLKWAKKQYQITPLDIMPLFTPLGFDLTVTTLFAPLLSGARIRVVPGKNISEQINRLLGDSELTILKLTPAHLSLLQSHELDGLRVDRVIVGGEQLTVTSAQAFEKKFSSPISVFNEYGPTEASVGCLCHRYDPLSDNEGAVPIGRPIDNLRAYILDYRGLPVLEGVKGELYIAGAGLASGYVNDSGLTDEQFLDDPFFPGEKMYKTGDLVRRMHDGNVEFISRVDNQRKIRGYRVELGEIQRQCTKIPAVKEAIITTRDLDSEPQLVAYILASETGFVDEQKVVAEIKSELKKSLPSYMIPQLFHFIDGLPVTENGKVDIASLPVPDQYSTETAPYEAPRNDTETRLLEIWEKLLLRESIGVVDNFFDIGGSSLLSFQLVSKMKSEASFDVSVTDVFEFPTIRSMSNFILQGSQATEQPAREIRGSSRGADAPVAIIGMAGRFPDADNIEAIWENLKTGHESLYWYSDQELLEAGVSPELVDDPNYIKSGAPIKGIKEFDAEYFGFTPREAQLMDPQQRLLFEVAVDTLEDGGYGDHAAPRNVGVFVGAGESFYFINNILPDRELMRTMGMEVQFGNSRDFTATRLSHRLNLSGPAMTVATACSTSLVAVHQAVASLRAGECQMALAGGAKVGQVGAQGYLYQEGGILSSDGHCRTFDQGATGTRSGDGCGLILLKPLEEAVRDGDTIHAVVKGSAVNNDAAQKSGYTAPSVSGQTRVILDALNDANVPPETIGYIEAHGTGTFLGDPIEVRALSRAYKDIPAQTALIGAVKPNIGHLDAAAGMASVIKTVLALKHKKIPPSINFEQGNRTIDFEASPFAVNTKLSDWPDLDAPKRAGVSSFGIGGTNAHLILEEATADINQPVDGRPAREQLIMLSAHTPGALDDKRKALIEFLARHEAVDLADLAFSLRKGRGEYPYREYLVAENSSDLASGLDATKSGSTKAESNVSVVMMFPGQGSQYLGAARKLYENDSRFADYFDQCAALFEKDIGFDLRIFLKCERTDPEALLHSINDTSNAQAVLFAYGWSIGRVLIDLGLKPDAMIGHSLGEYVAATLAGVFPVEQAAKLIVKRSVLMQQMPKGHMLSVACRTDELESILADTGAELAAENAPRSAVISVSPSNLEHLKSRLDKNDIPYRTLQTSHAFHSSTMEGAVEPFIRALSEVRFERPQIPIVSNVTGEFADTELADPAYWGRHLRQPVKFSQGLRNIFARLGGKHLLLVEAGVGNSLSTLAQKQAKSGNCTIVSAVPNFNQATYEYTHWLKSLGEIWKRGGGIEKDRICVDSRRRRIPLPGYPFQRRTYWIDPGSGSGQVAGGPSALARPATRLYQRDWRLSSRSNPGQADDLSAGKWLILGDDSRFTRAVAEFASAYSDPVVVVTQGDEFRAKGPQEFVVNPDIKEDYSRLIEALTEHDCFPDRIVHCGELCVAPSNHLQSLSVDTDLRSVQSALKLMQVILEHPSSGSIELALVSANAQRVTGNENINPAASLISGLANVLPQEYPEVRCQWIDLDLDDDGGKPVATEHARKVIDEFRLADRAPRIAMRGNSRWIPVYSPIDSEREMPAFTVGEGKTYLITGGLGNIALALAESLAEKFSAKIVLVSRRELPPENLWLEYTEKASPEDSIGQKLRQLLRIRDMAASLEIARGDVCDEQGMEAICAEVECKAGRIDGVIHAAGQVEGSATPIGVLSNPYFDLQYATKVRGVQVLDSVMASRDPDFIVLMSSLSTVLGGLGFTAYAAANAYMDGFVARKHNEGAEHWFAINWDGWHFDSAGEVSGYQEVVGVSPEQGVNDFYHAIGVSGRPVVIHSVGDLQPRLDKWVSNQARTDDCGGEQNRPDIETEYVPPSGAIEVRLAEQWKSLLGLSEVGANDDFFQLGGDSLLITRVVAGIRQEFKVSDKQLSLQEFFENPSIRKLAAQIEVAKDSELQGQRDLNESGKAIEEGSI